MACVAEPPALQVPAATGLISSVAMLPASPAPAPVCYPISTAALPAAPPCQQPEKYTAQPRSAAGTRVLEALLRENARFARGEQRTLSGVAWARERLAVEGQRPSTAVVACADSRVAPELLFRAGLGELFVIRAAGNTTWGDEVLGSLEYAVDHLGVEVVMVLGHTQCGAVGAAVAGGEPLPGALGKHIAGIGKAIEARGGRCGDVATAVQRNVTAAVDYLRADPAGCVAAAERAGRVSIVGAVYDIQSGKVAVLDPRQPPTPVSLTEQTQGPLRTAGRLARLVCSAFPHTVGSSLTLWHAIRFLLRRSRRRACARALLQRE